jgi:hypothetical protein
VGKKARAVKERTTNLVSAAADFIASQTPTDIVFPNQTAFGNRSVHRTPVSTCHGREGLAG